MDSIISFLKTLYYRNKLVFVLAVLVLAVIVIAGCGSSATGNAGAPPSGPIGGGCG